MSNTRRHILQVALRLFIRSGYRDVTFQRLIEEAGVSKGSFYHYWSGKLELFREVVEYFFFNYFRSFQYSRDDATLGDALEGMAADFQNMVEELFELVGPEENPFGYYLLVLEALRLFPDLQSSMSTEYQRFIDELTLVARRAQEAGEITDRISARAIAELIIPEVEGTALIVFIWQEEDFAGAMQRRLRSLYNLLTARPS
ncbi:MAG: TetR/AcrR family transcriptional regulator [Spirochaetaceae bacterium]